MSAKERALVERRALAYSRILETVEVGRTVKDDPTQWALFAAHYKRLDGNYKSFEDNHLAIMLGLTDTESKKAEDLLRKEADSAYFEAVSLYEPVSKLKDEKPNRVSANVKLPKINLIPFDGD